MKTEELKSLNLQDTPGVPLLEIKNLRAIYKTDLETVEAVNGISLQINQGKTFGLVGETGAGKTTTALSILRLLPSTTGRILEGEILFNGTNLLELDEGVMRAVRGGLISMVFQDPMSALNPVYTVDEQIGEAIRLHNPDYTKEQVEERVDEMLQLVGILPSRKYDYPHQFSGGMKQRVVIAMALCCEPHLLIADEPTTALDVTIQAQILELMQSLQKELGMAIIMITHDLGVVAQMCDEVIVMYAGSICEQGTADEIFYNPKHEYTKGLIRSIPTIDNDGQKLEPIAGTPIDLLNMPTGCPFAPRCDAAMKICLRERCKRMQINEWHQAACWVNVKEAAEKEGGDAQ